MHEQQSVLFGKVSAQADLLPGFVVNDRIVIARNLRVIQQDEPLKLEIPAMAGLIQQISNNQKGNDAKAIDTGVAVALAATVTTVAGIAWGAKFTFKDAPEIGDFRQFDIVFTWSDDSGARTLTVSVEPDRGFPGELWFINAFLSNGRTNLASTTAAGITATIAADTIRAGAVSELENQVKRDIEFLAR